MNILDAARAQTVLGAAWNYLSLGMSVIPVHGKKPALLPNGKRFGWQKFQTERAQPSWVERWARLGWLEGVAVVCGAISGNLCVMDLDGWNAVELFQLRFPDLLNTYTVLSGKGKHLYFYADSLPPTTRVLDTPSGGFELRVNGTYVVAPPSEHPDTHAPYVVINAVPIMRVPDLASVVTFIQSFHTTPNESRLANAPHPNAGKKRGRGGWRDPKMLYLETAVNGEVARVRRETSVGNRNNALNKAAYNLGKLLDAGLNRADVEVWLLDAALSVGLDEQSSLRTIASGLNAGVKHSRAVPEKR